MTEAFYKNLTTYFIEIRDLFSEESLNSDKINATFGSITFSRKQLEKNGRRREKKILIYCIDTLFDMLEEGDTQKISRFADLICTMPDIFLGKKRFSSFRKGIKLFNIEFNENCFRQIGLPRRHSLDNEADRPTKAHKNSSPSKSKRKLQIRFGVIMILGVSVCFIPLILYIIYIASFDENQSVGGWPLLGIIGALVIGVGLANIVATFFRQYLGHKVTAFTLIGGLCAVLLSVYMINHPELYDAVLSVYCSVSLIFLIFPTLFYAPFRISIEGLAKRSKKISSTRYRKLLVGKKNFWFYTQLHKEANLGILYYLNLIFIPLFVSVFVLTLLTGFIKEVTLLLFPMNLLLYALSACMALFSTIQNNRDCYGKSFILFRKNKRGGLDSIFLDIFAVLLPLILGYANLISFAEVWGIQLSFI
ncbi:MAG: hypothetical protein IJ488_02130 [Clostridia bacterium]|nr:hypothetical protein [Clostridia bacterium]